MFKKILTLVVVMLFGWQGLSFAAATQVDSLIEKLVEKGILDKSEARNLKMEIAEDAKVIQEDAAKAVVPDWVKNTKVKGDVRLRYQYERRANDTESRTRGRLRFRLGIENNPIKEVTVGVGLATAEVGSTTDDARSTNMTFTDGFRRGDIRLDYAYAQYQPTAWAKVIGGKYVKTDYLWTTSDMLWDSDINPAGASVNLTHKFDDAVSVFANSGAWVIDENNKTDRTDPYLVYGQGGVKYKENMFDATLAGQYYGFYGVKGLAVTSGTPVDGGAGSNTTFTSGGNTVLKYDYDSAGGSIEVGVNNPASAIPVERVALFGDYIQNLDITKDDEGRGWAAGAKLGAAKVSGPKQWQLKYQFTNLGKDAFIDAFPDSDRLGGATDVRGHEWELTIGLAKNISLGFDYYQDQRIKATKNPQRIAQADLNIKF